MPLRSSGKRRIATWQEEKVIQIRAFKTKGLSVFHEKEIPRVQVLLARRALGAPQNGEHDELFAHRHFLCHAATLS